MFHICQYHRSLIYICVVCGKKFSTVKKYMKILTIEEEEFKDESIKDVIKTKNEFKKIGRKDKGLKPSSHNTVADKADEASKSKETRHLHCL